MSSSQRVVDGFGTGGYRRGVPPPHHATAPAVTLQQSMKAPSSGVVDTLAEPLMVQPSLTYRDVAHPSFVRPTKPQPSRFKLASRFAKLPTSGFAQADALEKQLVCQGKRVIKLSIAEPD